MIILKKVVIVLGIVFSILLINNNKEELIIIPNEAIRVRVIANSYDLSDINVKEQLKERVSGKLSDLLENSSNIKEARGIITNNMNFINNFVDKSLKELNYDSKYSINYGMNYFPSKIFKGIVYEKGLYESLVITLGEGNGPNYWCVLYPPLCAIDNNITEVEYRSLIIDLINKYINKT